MALSSSTRLGPYEISGTLGAGGMGEVYRARDVNLQREVAIKVLPDAFAADADRVARFRREAQTLAALNHPHIAQVHGFEEFGERCALVMELVEGEDLAQRIARGPVPLDEALAIARQIAEGLEAAHDAGIIHRDLKPANIKLRPDGTVKVLDFGLAKGIDAASSASDVRAAANSPTFATPAMTHAGVILGTAAYMSPEQARGKPVDRRADIWAFGCVLYEMLAGTLAFAAGETVSDAVASILTRDPDWSRLPANTPPQVRVLLARCLEKDVKKRLPHVGVARLDLESVGIIGMETAATPIGRARAYAPALAVVAVLASIVTSAGWWMRGDKVPVPSITRFSLVLPDERIGTATRRLMGFSADGRMIAAAGGQLHVRALAGLEFTPVPGTEGLIPGHPLFTPDGRALVFHSTGDSTLKRVSLAGGPVTTLAKARSFQGMSWDGDRIVFAADGLVQRVHPDGGAIERLLEASEGETLYGPQVLPNGAGLLLTTLPRGLNALNRWDQAHVLVVRPTGERVRVIEGGSDAQYVATGHLIYARGGTLYALPFDLAGVRPRGSAVPVVDGVRQSANAASGVAQYSVSSAGMLAYLPGPVQALAGQDLALFDLDAKARPFKFDPGTYEYPRFSPDGAHVVFGTRDAQEAIVWVYELSGASRMRRLTFGGNHAYPLWSSDGRRITFQSDREGDAGIFWQPADGSGAAERLTRAETGTEHVPEGWSPDGGTLLFSVVRRGQFILHQFSLADRRMTPLPGIESEQPTTAIFSPDGRWFAYSLAASTSHTIYVEPFPPTGVRYQLYTKAGESPHHPTWAPDGSQLYYVPRQGELEVVAVRTRPSFAFGNPARVPRGFSVAPGTSPRTFDLSRDGRFFVGITAAGGTETDLVALQITVVLNWLEELKQKVSVSAP